LKTPSATGRQNDGWYRGARVILITAATFVVIAGLKAAAPIVNYFLISLLLALISATPVFWLQRKGVPVVLGVVLVSIAIIVAITFTAFMLVGSLSAFSARLPEYQIRLQENLAPLQSWLQSKGIELSGPTLFPELDPRNALGLVMKLLGNIGGMLSNLLLILLTVIFMLLDTAGFKDRLRELSPDPSTSLQRYGEMTTKIRHYLVLKTWLSLATGIGVAIWVALLGLDFPLIWALLAFFFNFIPNIGSILAAIPAILLALVQLGAWQAMLVALGYIVVNVVIGNLVEPRVMGRGVGVPGSVVFLSMIFWGWVLGPVGMILSVPLTVIVIIALGSSTDTRWLATLLSSDNSRRVDDQLL
jgi:predicted PurR-regulated permease PerM